VTIESAEDVQRALGSDTVGSHTTLVVLRGGARTSFDAIVGERPAR
jgi:hypothetical protein